MSEITIHTGSSGDTTVLHVSWFDENNVRQMTDVEIRIQDQDKPRTLELMLNGIKLAEIPANTRDAHVRRFFPITPQEMARAVADAK